MAQALVRAGHIVYGVTRSEEKAQRLAEEESKLFVQIRRLWFLI